MSFFPFPIGSLILICSTILLLPLGVILLYIFATAKAYKEQSYRTARRDTAVIVWSLVYMLTTSSVCFGLLIWRYSAIAISV